MSRPDEWTPPTDWSAAETWPAPPGNPNTPSLTGYVWGVVVAWLVFDLSFLVFAVADGMPGSEFLWMLTILVVDTVFVGGLVALIGALLVHAVCRNQPRQWVHVLVAGLVGFALVLVPLTLMGVMGPVIAILVGFSAAIGRAVVSPRRPR